jgi:hypothetical protein
MNKWILRLLAGVAVTSAGNAIASQNPVSADEEAWGRAVSVNTLEAYAKFSMDFPQSKFVNKAHAKLATAGNAKSIVQGAVSANEPSNGSSDPEFVPNSLMVV